MVGGRRRVRGELGHECEWVRLRAETEAAAVAAPVATTAAVTEVRMSVCLRSVSVWVESRVCGGGTRNNCVGGCGVPVYGGGKVAVCAVGCILWVRCWRMGLRWGGSVARRVFFVLSADYPALHPKDLGVWGRGILVSLRGDMSLCLYAMGAAREDCTIWWDIVVSLGSGSSRLGRCKMVATCNGIVQGVVWRGARHVSHCDLWCFACGAWSGYKARRGGDTRLP